MQQRCRLEVASLSRGWHVSCHEQAMSDPEIELQTPIAEQARRVRARGVAARQGAERQDLDRPRADAGGRRRDRRRLSCLHKTARVFDFRSEAPIIRFLDTRGLGEAAYDPEEDIAFCEGRSHLILAVVKALDLEQRAVLDVIRAAKGRHPEWPVVVAQTSLHEGYATGERHALPYPFGRNPWRAADRKTVSCVRSRINARCFGRFLGWRRWPSCRSTSRRQVTGMSPLATAGGADRGPDRCGSGRGGRRSRRSCPVHRATMRPARASAHILGFALAAGASDAFPLAGAVAVPLVQAAMLRQLAKLYGVTWDKCAMQNSPARWRRNAGAGRFDVRRAPARQADSGLRSDGRCGGGGGRQLCRHLRHGQGGQLFPGHASAGEGKRRDRLCVPGGAAGGLHHCQTPRCRRRRDGGKP